MKSNDQILLENAYEQVQQKKLDWRLEAYIEQGSSGDLSLDRVPITELPDNLVINGSLNLNCCSRLKALPNGLTVNGDLDLYGCGLIKELPLDAKIRGTIDLRGTSIKILPPNLHVKGSLYISRQTKISDNTTVEGTLHIDTYYHKYLEPLPKKLKVNSLYCPNLELQDLPDDLEVKDAVQTRRFSVEQIKKYLDERNKISKLKEKLPELEGVF